MAPWTARGWKEDSPGCIWWFFNQRPQGPLCEHGEDIVRRVLADAAAAEGCRVGSVAPQTDEGKQAAAAAVGGGGEGSADPLCVRAHLFAHRYALGGRKETRKDK